MRSLASCAALPFEEGVGGELQGLRGGALSELREDGVVEVNELSLTLKSSPGRRSTGRASCCIFQRMAVEEDIGDIGCGEEQKSPAAGVFQHNSIAIQCQTEKRVRSSKGATGIAPCRVHEKGRRRRPFSMSEKWYPAALTPRPAGKLLDLGLLLRPLLRQDQLVAALGDRS